jgi:hypothetical protein
MTSQNDKLECKKICCFASVLYLFALHLKILEFGIRLKTGLTVFGARHYCHIVFVCSWAQAGPYFWREDSPTREHEPQCQLRLSLQKIKRNNFKHN